MLRILLIFAVLALLLGCLGRLLRRAAGKDAPQAARKKPDTPQLKSAKMVKCAYCELYVTLDEALQSGERYFCSEGHRERLEGRSDP